MTAHAQPPGVAPGTNSLAPAGTLPLPPFPAGRLAYLASRHPVVSHTFVDNEILGLEAAGWPLCIASLNPPKDEFSHPRLLALRAPRLYPPPPAVLEALEARARREGFWPQELIARHEAEFGRETKPAERARHALWLGPALQRAGVGHIHLHFANAATHTALFVKELFGIGFSFTPQARDFLVETGPELLAELVAQARLVVTPCHYAARALQGRIAGVGGLSSGQAAEVEPGKLVTVYNGIDPAPYPRAAPNPDGARRLLAVGRLVPIKGFATLLRAFARARVDLPELSLRIIGDGPLRAELEALTAEFGLGEAVAFLGQQSIEVMREEMARADLLALSAEEDAQGGSDMLPTVITEAMFCALPILATRIAAIPEQVIEGETGLLCEPGDVAGLSEALRRLAREPGLARTLGLAGRARAEALFTQARTLPQFAQALVARLEGERRAAEATEASAQASFAAPVLPALPDPSAVLAAYDLGQPKRLEWLLAEAATLRERDGRILILGSPEAATLAAIDQAGLLGELAFLPDGMVLEMAWAAHPAARALAASWRRQLSSAIDGELLLAAARRATWLASQRVWPQRWFAPGVAETLVLALAKALRAELNPDSAAPELLACLDSAQGWNGKLLRFLADQADRLDDASGRAEVSSNALLHADPVADYRKLGPITHRRKPVAVTAAERAAALSRWLG